MLICTIVLTRASCENQLIESENVFPTEEHVFESETRLSH